MKKIYTAAAVSVSLVLSSCSFSLPFEEGSTSEQSVQTEAPVTDSNDITEAVPETTPLSENGEDSAETTAAEISTTLSYENDPDIPEVAWTEIYFDKTMYALSDCIGYDAALPEGNKIMIYDPGYEFWIIARTSTGYYRTDEDVFIPCGSLDNEPPEGSDPYYASCEPYSEN